MKVRKVRVAVWLKIQTNDGLVQKGQYAGKWELLKTDSYKSGFSISQLFRQLYESHIIPLIPRSELIIGHWQMYAKRNLCEKFTRFLFNDVANCNAYRK
jgi:hypothetical protein